MILGLNKIHATLLGLMLIGVSTYAISSWRASHNNAAAVVAEAQANQQVGQANSSHTTAVGAEMQIAAVKPVLVKDERLVKQLKQEREELLAKLELAKVDHEAEREQLLAVVEKDKEVIAALDTEVTDLKLQLGNLTLRGDAYRDEAEHLRKALELKEIAHSAQVSALKADMMMLRIKWGGVSFGSGFLVGKIL